MLSPSSLDRRVACPGSEREESRLPRETGGSEAAARGQMLHEVMKVAAQTGTLSGSGYEHLEEADQNDVLWCWERVERALSLAKSNPSWIVLIERRLDLSSIGLNVENDPERCRVDLAIVIPGARALLYDFKFGDLPGHNPRFDWQFRAYATGLHINFGVPEVEVVRLQPRLDEDRSERKAIFSAEDMATFAEAIKAAAELCELPDAPTVLGPHCLFCKAKQTCPSRSGAIGHVVPAGMPVAAFLGGLEPEDRARQYRMILTAAEWIAAVKDSAKQFILDGGEIPGWKVGPGKGKRAWTDPKRAEAALRALLREKGKEEDLAVSSEILSPAQAEKIVGKSKAVQEALAPLQVKVSGELTVLADNDRD